MIPSVRRRLLLILLFLFVFGWLSVVIVTYTTTSNRINKVLDAELEQDADVLAYLARTGAPQWEHFDTNSRLALPEHHRGPLAFQIWKQSRLVLTSGGLPPIRAPEHNGYRDIQFQGRTWHTLIRTHGSDDLAIVLAEPLQLRYRLIDGIARESLYPLFLAIPALAVLIWFGVGRGLVPMARLARQMEQRSPEYLQPIPTDGAPQELLPLMDRLNDLLARLQDAFTAERRFTADAAHEIRTPLAAVKTHAQLLLRAPDTAVRETALREIVAAVDRSTHLVDQLLSLARLDREAQELGFEDVDLATLVRETAATLHPLAQERGIELEVEARDRPFIAGNTVALKTLVRNLLDNAVRYTPRNGKVHVCVSGMAPNEVCLSIEDSGPGIPVELRERVFDRFYRFSPGDTAGCGLGLSIGRRIAELHRARIELGDSSRHKGLHVLARFPAGQVEGA